MTRLPALTPRKLIRALQKAGFQLHHQTGGHLALRHPVTHARTTVPIHSGDLKRHVLKYILKQTGLSLEQLRRLL